MTATTATPAVAFDPGDRPLARLRQATADTVTIAQRNLITLRRVPQLLIFSTIQPVIFVLLFRYVFGGAIHVPGQSYVDFLMPGVFAQTVAFGAMNTAIGLATDMNTGLIERFRSLPMARSAVLAGRTLADAVRNVLVVALMAAVGFLVGFRVHTNVVAFLGAMALLVLFGYALSWVFAAVGLAVGDPETAQAAAFPVMAPLVFASAAFVPVASMPGWLQPFARNQPLSVVVDASRDLVLGGPTTTHVLQALAWCAVILAVAAPLAVRRYRRAA
jgi:ABC-2 type transport system permease protein/oleandomycin transport system permease protein